MAKPRGRYASPVQIERRLRILSQTQLLLEAEGLDAINMSRIAELSDVSTKTLYNIFSNRNALLLDAAAAQLDAMEASPELLKAEPGIPRMYALTQIVMSKFQHAPEYMESVVSIVVQSNPEEEARFDRMGRMQRWCLESLTIADKQQELLPETDCLQLSQMLAGGQWGLTLMWQKGLISVDQLAQQAPLKHCIMLLPFCVGERRAWLEENMFALLNNKNSTARAPKLVKA